MGSGRYDPSAYAGFTTRTASMSTAAVFSKTSLDKALDPKGVAVRESRDSADNPSATPVIVALDVTGSMGILADAIARKGLGVLFQEILDRQPVPDPHLMFMGVGDAVCDNAPLQVSQFEADNRIVEQLTQIYIEHGGGGNGTESYQFPWYFAALHTAHDAYEKRSRRGYLFTVGDEEAPENLTKEQIERFTGDIAERDYTPAELLAMAEEMYHVFHVVVEEGSHCRHPGTKDRVMSSWQALLGQRVLHMSDHTKLAEIIVSTIQITEGAKPDVVAGSWGGDTALVVANATRGLTASSGASKSAVGVKRF